MSALEREIMPQIAHLAVEAEMAGLYMQGSCSNRRSDYRSTPIRLGYGQCSSCSCPGFSGSGYTCSRGGCGHHYNTHW